ncbi:MAG: methyltransferase family protein [Pontibacterium sp.]
MLLGNVLLAMGFANAILLNVYMGNQWRSGIDPNGPTLLITQGLFKYSRNPMFLGVGIAQLGFFLALPSWFSLICLMVGWAAIYRQTISEEKHLQARFPDEYAIYTTKVRRWL